MKTSPTNKKVREIINLVKEKKLVPKPEFQRRLIWSRENKDFFLDSVLRGYPFPEIYFADGEVDLETSQGTQLLVDGLQRVHTLIQYFDGDPELKITTVPPYRSLKEEEKRAFLQYDVAVRDLGSISKDEIIEVFRRLNATNYSLKDIEINNAVYDGALKKFCVQISEENFFKIHEVFNQTDYKRMGDLRYVLGIVGTMLQGYFNRDDAFGDLLDRYNDEFPQADMVRERLDRTFSFIDECAFDTRSRVWKKADLFTLLVEIDQALSVRQIALQPSQVLEHLGRFYGAVDGSPANQDHLASTYYKAALQASNDKINRVRRGVSIAGVLEGHSHEKVMEQLRTQGLV